MPDRVVLDAAQMWVRHIKRAPDGTPGATLVLGRAFVPADPAGVNGRQGWQSGSYERRLGEDGSFTLTFPNAAGADGVLHRERFALLTDPSYRPGEEWLEIYRGDPGDAVLVGTPVRYSINPGQVEVSGYDVGGLLKKVREGEVGFWAHAPRDVFEHYTQAWTVDVTDDFESSTFTQNSGSLLTSGPWSYRRVETLPGPARLRITHLDGFSASHGMLITTVSPFNVGALASAWRIEATVEPLTPNTRACLDVRPSVDTTGSRYRMELIHGGQLLIAVTNGTTVVRNIAAGPHALAMEARGRWLYCYVDGQLVGVRPLDFNSVPGFCGVFPHLFRGGEGNAEMLVHDVTIRHIRPFALRGPDKGDYRLPGAPAAGGLHGEYFSEASLRGQGTPTFVIREMPKPTNERVGSRVDGPVNMPANNPPSWAAAFGLTEYFSVRWTGAIFLDLEASDRVLSFSGGNDNLGRFQIWVGRTGPGEQIIDYCEQVGHPIVFNRALRQFLGNEKGWFPIVIEMSHLTGSNGFTLYDQPGSTFDLGTRQIVPSSRLSPYGCFTEHVRLESHREMLDQLAASFGIQWTCEPRQLESGEFPGQIVPRIRHGRDTEVIIDEDEATQYAVEGDAEDTVDALLADAAGIADPDGARQLTAEVIDPDQIGAHLLTHTDYESLSEISQETLLVQRIRSLLGLRSSAWEQVSAQPRGASQLVDSFPLSGQLARCDWQPGDGVRVMLAPIGVRDATPRQILGVQWPIVPDGRGLPTASFRQRPRGLRDLIKRLQRTALSPQRNFQGQLITVVSNVASHPTGGSLPDSAARVGLPANLDNIVRATLVVQLKTTTSSMNVGVNGGSAVFTVVTSGRYDLTPHVARDGTASRMYVQLNGSTGPSDVVEWSVELLVRL